MTAENKDDGAPKVKKVHDLRLGRALLHAGLASLALAVLQIMLALPGGLGAESFLALGPADLAEFDAVREAWGRLVLFKLGSLKLSLQVVALLYFALDTIVFMPLYASLLFRLVHWLGRADQHAHNRSAARALLWLTPALLALDLIENSAGLARLAYSGMTLALTGALAAGAAACAWALWRRKLGGADLLAEVKGLRPPWEALPKRLKQVLLAAAVAAAALVAAHGFALDTALTIGAQVHGAKLALVLAVLALLTVLGIAWVFRRDGTLTGRPALRRGLVDIFWRTRYVLAALGLLVALTLALDQCRDVLIGMAEGLFAWPRALWAWPTAVLSVLAVWSFSFSCWLWTRLVCRMPSPGGEVQKLPEDVETTLRTAALGAARVLGIAPAVLAAVLSAQAARDAVWAGSRSDVAAIFSPTLLLLMGLACVLGGKLFLWGRERASSNDGAKTEDYYNDSGFAANSDWLQQVAADKYRFVGGRGPGPFSLPIIALALAVGLRCAAVAFDPGVPVAFAVIVFALTGWLGFFGWLSMKEQRDSRPWLLALIAVVGVLGATGFTDNHAVRVIVDVHGAALPSLGWQIAGTLGLAALVLAAAWAVARSTTRLSWVKVLGGVGLAAVLLLVVFDRASSRDAALPQAPTDRASIDEAIERWVQGLWRDGKVTPPERLFLVASEGGGVRAAYWTARSLQLLRAQVTDFDRRTLMLSGVSGGAVGEAVYRACTSSADAANCVNRFGDADLLTPLLGAWLFEDALARVLPTSLPTQRWFHGLCVQPGCGFLTRGMWFEQALERAVPELAMGIGASGGNGGPLLFLNATSVETGDRAVAASVRTDWQQDPFQGPFTNVRDQLQFAARGGEGAVDMPLSAAAHNAARFPFVNAIGRLRTRGSDHRTLADGGYFDNAGAHTTIDVLSRLRTWIAQQPDCGADDKACQRRLGWLRQLKPTVIVMQNGVVEECKRTPPDARLNCLKRIWGLPDGGAADPYQPAQPREAGHVPLFVDVLGPLVTVINVAGTGANGRRAESLLQRECGNFGDPNCVVRLAQRSDGLLYPLGWYLSQTARCALDLQALARTRELALALGEAERPGGAVARGLKLTDCR